VSKGSIRAKRWGGALAGALVLGELLCRWKIAGPLDLLRHSADPGLVYELKPGTYVSDGYFLRSPTVTYAVDERGCRLVPGAAKASGAKLLFLGSSIVFGIAVEADVALPEAARRALAAGSPPRAIEALNCSIPGYDLLQTLHHAEVAVDQLGVKSLALVVGPKHGMVPYDWTRTEPQSPTVKWLAAHSRLVRLGHLVSVIRESHGFRLPPIPPEELRAALDRFAAAMKAKGVRATVFVVGKLEHPSVDLPKELQSRGIAMVAVKAPPNDGRHVHADGDHWSAEGVRFMVAQMAPALGALVE
jgi:hypothetical protein